jgi:two-component system NarL family sensor kinase
MERRDKQLAVVNAIAQIVARSPDITDILEQAVQRLLEVTELEAGSVFLLNESKDVLERVVCIGFSEEYQRAFRTVKVGDHLTGRVAKQQQPIFVEDINEDRRTAHMVKNREGIRSFASIPLCSKGRLLGVMNVVSRGFLRFGPSDISLLSAVGDQIAVAIDNAQLFEKSAHLAVVEERNWLAREIHDTLAQGLVALALQLELALTQLVDEGDAAKTEASLQKALALVRENLEEARRSVANLRGDRIAQLGLTRAINQLVESFEEDTGVQTHLFISKRLGKLPINLEEGLYRIAREALSNVRKHAHAREARVSLQRRESNVQLTVQDDGLGFNPYAAAPPGHFGILGMGEQASLLGGRLDVESRPGHGALIRAVVPIRRSQGGDAAHD